MGCGQSRESSSRRESYRRPSDDDKATSLRRNSVSHRQRPSYDYTDIYQRSSFCQPSSFNTSKAESENKSEGEIGHRFVFPRDDNASNSSSNDVSKSNASETSGSSTSSSIKSALKKGSSYVDGIKKSKNDVTVKIDDSPSPSVISKTVKSCCIGNQARRPSRRNKLPHRDKNTDDQAKYNDTQNNIMKNESENTDENFNKAVEKSQLIPFCHTSPVHEQQQQSQTNTQHKTPPTTMSTPTRRIVFGGQDEKTATYEDLDKPASEANMDYHQCASNRSPSVSSHYSHGGIRTTTVTRSGYTKSPSGTLVKETTTTITTTRDGDVEGDGFNTSGDINAESSSYISNDSNRRRGSVADNGHHALDYHMGQPSRSSSINGVSSLLGSHGTRRRSSSKLAAALEQHERSMDIINHTKNNNMTVTGHSGSNSCVPGSIGRPSTALFDSNELYFSNQKENESGASFCSKSNAQVSQDGSFIQQGSTDLNSNSCNDINDHRRQRRSVLAWTKSSAASF